MRFKKLLIGSLACVSTVSPVVSNLSMPKMVQSVLNDEKQETPKYNTSNLEKINIDSIKTSDDKTNISLIQNKTKSIKFDSDTNNSNTRLKLKDNLTEWSTSAADSGFEEPTFDGVKKITFQSNQHTDERVIYSKFKIDYTIEHNATSNATCVFTNTFNVDVLGWHNNHISKSYINATIQLFELEDENDEPEYISQYAHEGKDQNDIEPCKKAFQTWKFNHWSWDWFNVSWPHRQYEIVKSLKLENNTLQDIVISKYYGISLAISGENSWNANTQVHMDLNISSVANGRKESQAQAEINQYKALINAGMKDYLCDENLQKEDLQKRYDNIKQTIDKSKSEYPDSDWDSSLSPTKENFVDSLTIDKEKGIRDVNKITKRMIESVEYLRRKNAHGWLKSTYSINDKIGVRSSSETFTDTLVPFEKLNEKIEIGETLNTKSWDLDHYNKTANNGQLHYDEGDNFFTLNTQFNSKSKTFYFPFKVSVAFPNNANLSYKLSTAWQASITNYVMDDNKPNVEPKYSVQLFNFGEDENATPTNFYGLHEKIDSKNVDNYCYKNWVQEGGKFADEYKSSNTDLVYHPCGESNPENGSFAYTFWNEGNGETNDIVKNIYFGLLIHQQSNGDYSFGDSITLKNELIDLSECIKPISNMSTSYYANSNQIDKVLLSDMKPDCGNAQYEVITGNGGIEFKPISKSNDLRAVYSRNQFKTWLPAHSEALYGCKVNARSVFERGDNLTAWTYTIKNNISLFDLGEQDKSNPSFIPNKNYDIKAHQEEAKENNLISSIGHELHGSADVMQIIFLTIQITIDVILLTISAAQIAKIFRALKSLKQAGLFRNFSNLKVLKNVVSNTVRCTFSKEAAALNGYIESLLSEQIAAYGVDDIATLFKQITAAVFLSPIFAIASIGIGVGWGIKLKYNIKTNVNYLYSGLKDGDKIFTNMGSFNFVVRNDSNEDKFVYHDFGVGYVHDGQRSQETPTNSTTIVYMDFNLSNLKKIDKQNDKN